MKDLPPYLKHASETGRLKECTEEELGKLLILRSNGRPNRKLVFRKLKYEGVCGMDTFRITGADSVLDGAVIAQCGRDQADDEDYPELPPLDDGDDG